MLNSQKAVEQLSVAESWRVFRIVAELTEGLEKMSLVGRPCVSVFGSARVKPESPIYAETVEIGRKLTEAGYGVITGGGPGLMEAANKGAFEANGVSVGLTIDLPHEQAANSYLTHVDDYRYFFLRKLMFIKYAKAYVVVPGGMGTLDELTEAFVLAQTMRIEPFPIILYKSAYWAGFVDWLKTRMVEDGYISEEEIDQLITVCDTPEAVVRVVLEFSSGKIR